MSYIGSEPRAPGARPARSSWRWFPLGLVLSMSVVIVVNGGMVWEALSTNPGPAGEDGFDLSNGYDRVLARVERQAALGWNVRVDADATHHVTLALTDAAGAPLADAVVEAHAERPIGPATNTPLALAPIGAGRYVAANPLAMPGQWDVFVYAKAGNKTFTTTRRVIVR